MENAPSDYNGLRDVLLCNRSSGRHQGQIWTNDSDTTDLILMQGNVFWMILSILIVIGNLTVIIWRCVAKGEQRNSIPSILVINLATADFFLGIQISVFVLLLLTLTAERRACHCLLVSCSKRHGKRVDAPNRWQ